MNKQQSTSFLIVIYGSPASGKSTFCSYLRSMFPEAISISVDKIESYLKSNQNVPEQTLQFFRYMEKQPLEKVEFDPNNWKKSRQFTQEMVYKLVSFINVIVEDDLLLDSQRKPYRKIANDVGLLYLEIMMETTMQQCLENMKKRKNTTKDYLNQDVIQKAINKLEYQEKYGIKLSMNNRAINHQFIEENLKKVTIIQNHQKVKGQKSDKDLIQIKIRKFISSIMQMSPVEIEQKYGLTLQKKQLSTVLAKWKKQLKQPINQELEQNLKLFIN